MADSTVTLAELLRAYERSLIARVQLTEFANWGPATTDSFRLTVEQHATMERAYLARVLEHRRREGSGGPLP